MNAPTATTLDSEISALCDDAATWLVMAACSAQYMGITLPAGIAALLAAETEAAHIAKVAGPDCARVFTGYQPAAVRTNVRARSYRDGLRSAPRRSTAGDRAQAEAAAWGLAVAS